MNPFTTRAQRNIIKPEHNRGLLAGVLAILALMLTSTLATAVEEGTTIIGNQESPTVLNVVPWKSKELSVDPWETQKGPSNSMLNQVLKPLDREELLREVEYFDMINKKEENVE